MLFTSLKYPFIHKPINILLCFLSKFGTCTFVILKFIKLVFYKNAPLAFLLVYINKSIHFPIAKFVVMLIPASISWAYNLSWPSCLWLTLPFRFVFLHDSALSFTNFIFPQSYQQIWQIQLISPHHWKQERLQMKIFNATKEPPTEIVNIFLNTNCLKTRYCAFCIDQQGEL